MSTLTKLPLLSILIAVACGGGGPPPPDAAAKAAAEKKKADEEALAKRKAEREAKEKAKEDAEAKRLADIDALTVVPEGTKLPKDLVKACDAVAESHDKFMNRLFEGKAVETWNGGGKGTQLPMTKVQCTQADSIEVAVCQKHALDSAPPELKKALPDFFRGCIDKYAKKGGKAAGPKAKPG